MNAVSVSAAKARRFDPTGHCIYCGGAGAGKLTKEHIFPQGLGGGLILPEASCATCQKEIHSFETVCMRQILLPYRKITGLVRHLDDLPATLPLVLDFELQGPTHVAIDAHPDIVVLPGMRDLPGILTDTTPQPSIEFEHQIFGHTDILAETKAKFRALKNVGVNSNGYAWLRMLAKIAHGYAFAELGLKRFEPALPDFILGRNPRLASYLIGKCDQPFPIPTAPPLLMIEMKSANRNGQSFAAVNMRLFAELGNQVPVYTVIAGVLKSELSTSSVEIDPAGRTRPMG